MLILCEGYLPTYAKQRCLDYLNDRFGCTGDRTFDSLMEFVVREERCKASDFVCRPAYCLSKTGWYACGDISPLEKAPVKICRVQACTDKFWTPLLTQLLLLVKTEYENLKRLYEKSRWRNADLDSYKSDKEAKSLLMHMKPSRFLILRYAFF